MVSFRYSGGGPDVPLVQWDLWHFWVMKQCRRQRTWTACALYGTHGQGEAEQERQKPRCSIRTIPMVAVPV